MSEPSNPTDGREFERKDVLFSAKIGTEDEKIDCDIINISFGGAQIRMPRTLKAGAKISLEIEPFGVFATEVRWCRKPDVGLKFNEDSSKVAELVMAIATYA